MLTGVRQQTKKLRSSSDTRKEIRTFIIQDVTNNILKHDKSAAENFEEHKKLLSLCLKNFKLEVCVICEIPPLKDMEQNKDKNNEIDEIIYFFMHSSFICYRTKSCLLEQKLKPVPLTFLMSTFQMRATTIRFLIMCISVLNIAFLF